MKPDKSLSGRIIEGNYLLMLLKDGRTTFTDAEHKLYIESVNDAIKGEYWVHDNYDLKELREDYSYLIKKNTKPATSYEIILMGGDIDKTIYVCESYFNTGIPSEIDRLLKSSFEKSIKRVNFAFRTQNMKPLEEGGVQKACYIVREWINHHDYPESCGVTEDEYKEAIYVLVAFGYTNAQSDTTVNTFNCVPGCDTSKHFCDGEFCLSLIKNKKPCPYLVDDPGE